MTITLFQSKRKTIKGVNWKLRKKRASLIKRSTGSIHQQDERIYFQCSERRMNSNRKTLKIKKATKRSSVKIAIREFREFLLKSMQFH